MGNAATVSIGAIMIVSLALFLIGLLGVHSVRLAREVGASGRLALRLSERG